MKLLIIEAFLVILCFIKVAENVTAMESLNNSSENLLKKRMDLEHSAVLKWKKFDAILQDMSSLSVKKLFPYLLRANEGLNLSSSCSRSVLKFLTGVKQMKLWAFKMLDASGKLPNGILSGSINSLGEYDECIDVNVTGHFQGQYCTVYVQPPLPERLRFVSADSEITEFMNITDRNTVTGELLRRARYYYHLKFRTSVCVPSTCSRDEVEEIANKVMETIGVEFNITIPNCEIKEKQIVLSVSQIVVIVILSVLLLFGISATAIDTTIILRKSKGAEKKLSFFLKCIQCFSFYSNTVRLLKKDDSPDTIKIFHGMKVVTLLWVILNHTYYYINFQAGSSLLVAREKGKEILFQFVINGFLNVETFFFISSVLVAYGVKKMKARTLNVPLFIIRRFWRLSPSFMLVIVSVQLMPLLGSGPVWKETVVQGLTEKCQNYWWANFLYINNFIPSAKACLPWHWYIPVDTHLYMLSLVVLIPLKKHPLLAFVLNGVILVCGIIITAVNNVYYRLPPTAIYVYNHPEDIDYYVDNGYFRTYLHCSTYCVGLTVGYIIASKPELRIPKIINLCGWITSFVLALTVLYGVYEWNQGKVPSLLISTLYTCANKLIWSLALAWVTISCMTGNGGIATKLLSWQVFVPLGRLTYMTYLIHPLIQFIYIGSSRTLMRTDHRTLIYMYLANVVLAFMCAYALSLVFESPFMAIEKLLFTHRRNTKSDDPIGTPQAMSEKNMGTADFQQRESFPKEITETEARIRR